MKIHVGYISISITSIRELLSYMKCLYENRSYKNDVYLETGCGVLVSGVIFLQRSAVLKVLINY